MQSIFKESAISNQELASLVPISYFLIPMTGGHYAA